jgi:catechol 2,3-dioxygenase-like lactoylglutathione lyase family enzyme
MTIRGIDHINISTDRLAETCAFFKTVLGLSDGFRPPFPFGGAWLYQGDQAIVHIIEKDRAMVPSSQASLDHFAFAIDDYEEMEARLQANGIEYRPLDVPGTSIRQMFLQDPNGVNIELNWKGDRPAG